MKNLRKLLCLLLAVLMITGCTNLPGAETTAPVDDPNVSEKTEAALAQIAQLGSSPDDNYRTWYEIFVYSYCDSNGDGIGDLNGVTSKLDELTALGINGIWLMPIHPSTSYHKYNVTDYYEIDPAYGTMEDFDNLLAECEKRGIKVILDLVLNHTGYTHEWFQTAIKYLRDLPEGKEPDVAECKYLDYYFFSKNNGPGMRKISGSDWYFEGQFDYQMPDLNFGNEALRSDIKDIMQFWLDKGVGGFRLDAAKEFYTGHVSKNVEVLSWIQKTATSIDPDCYLVAEVWENEGTIASYYKSGITSIFNFGYANSTGKIIQTLRGAGVEHTVSAYVAALEGTNKAFRENNPDYIDAPFLSNHDIGRIAGFASRNELKIKMAGAMNIFMSGSVFIYYGEEIGMTGSGNDPSKRAPMYWNAERNNGTTNPPPECELPDEYPFGSLAEQKGDDNSIYNYYRQAVAIRNALPAISHGVTTAEEALNVNCISAQRKTWNDQSCIILMNVNTEAAQVDLSAYSDWTVAATLSADGNEITQEGSALNLPAFGIAVLIPNT